MNTLLSFSSPSATRPRAASSTSIGFPALSGAALTAPPALKCLKALSPSWEPPILEDPSRARTSSLYAIPVWAKTHSGCI
ncbi:hypothetical protein SLEP1_g43653 [Rubroshorea leprosula]|uniref:Uncharacterized protein n=1 Tax=Rubroshorea leprosula TaxID=152421 RepID=A0AAV5LEN0_9ROSI|nr:hypothetical protein SLEP1_g43653 [Rubroshorea leprosula]